MSLASRLGIGTVQFGLSYGATNTRGQVPGPEVSTILKQARQAGVTTIDTAAAYGSAETVLGESDLRPYSIVTKIPAQVSSRAEVIQAVKASLTTLKVPRFYGVLAHQGSTLLGPQGAEVWSALEELKSRGLVERIGSSVYTVEELQALRAKYSLGLVQVPYSVFNQSFDLSGELQALKDLGCEIHARSIFLQGTLLTPVSQLPSYFASFRSNFDALATSCARLGVSPMELCLGQALHCTLLDRVIVGVTGVAELEQILAATKRAPLLEARELHSDDERLTNPARWKL